MSPIDGALTSWAVALGIGLLIGAERERRKGDGPERAPAGLRTFALAALLGAVSIEIGGAVLLSVVAAGVLVLTAVSYFRSRSDDPGLTTEIALIMTVLLGAYAMREPAHAAGIGVVVAVLLAARAPMHEFVRKTVTPTEARSALIFAAATLVIWPLLPDRYLGPFAAINPQRIWAVAILIMAISAAGHIAVRLFGSRLGLAMTGLASGFVSSSATIATMGVKARENPTLLRHAVAGAVLSTVATFILGAIVLGATSVAALQAVAMPLALGLAAAIAYALAFSARPKGDDGAVELRQSEVFSLRTAVLLAFTLAAVLAVATVLRAWLGDRGTIAAAALTGLVDSHATAVSVASHVAAGRLSAADAVVPILVGFTTNALTKIVMAASSGGAKFALRVVPGILLATAAMWLGYVCPAPL